MSSKIYPIKDGMSINRRHIVLNVMNVFANLNDISEHNISRETLDKVKIDPDSFIKTLWNRQQDITKDDVFVVDQPALPGVREVVEFDDGGEYQINWSCNVQYDDTYNGTFEYLKLIPFCGSRLLWSGADYIQPHFPFSYVSSAYERTEDYNTSMDYPQSLSGTCTFSVSSGNLNIGVIAGGLSLNGMVGAHVKVTDFDMTIYKRER